MPRYVTTDGRFEFEGDDAREVVRQMRDSEWKWHDRKLDYMTAVAGRVEEITGQRVRTYAEAFVADLVALGFLRPVNGG